MIWRALLLVVVASPGWADDPCPDLWFARNILYEAQGHCFSTPLGKSVFDNGDCTGPAALTGEAEARAGMIKGLEEAHACAVDTGSRDLGLWQQNLRHQLEVQPISDGLESACVMETPATLRRGPSPGAAIMAEVSVGDIVVLAHDGAGGWDFASKVIRNEVALPVIGWFRSGTCRVFAG